MIPICCIAYNRTGSLERLLKSLEKAYYDEAVTLIISIDKSNTDEVEVFADSYQWPFGDKKVIKHEENLGLRKHVLSCGELLKNYDAIIVLEDDITVAQSFYTYAKQCVDKYQRNTECAGISLYNFTVNYQNRLPFAPLNIDSDVYMMRCAQSWGQVWMKSQWFDFVNWLSTQSGEFDEDPHLPSMICRWPKSSWLKFHTKYCIEQKKYFIYPYVSLSTNNADAGTHISRRTTVFQTPLLYGEKKVFRLTPAVMYDGFFENEGLARCFGIDERELCVDLYGEKQNREQKRYWLTLEKKNFRIINNFALELKPWDANILENKPGNCIFLYDTSEIANNRFEENYDNKERYFYSMNKSSIKQIIYNSIKLRIGKLFHFD